MLLTLRLSALTHAPSSYGFGETRVATLALLTLTALPGRRSSGVVITKFSGHAVTFRKSANGLCRHSDAWVYLDPRLIRQATKRYAECCNAFGLVSHQGFRSADRICCPKPSYNLFAPAATHYLPVSYRPSDTNTDSRRTRDWRRRIGADHHPVGSRPL